MLGIKMGAVIGTEISKAPEPCIIGDITDIQARVGGCFDCVSVDIGSQSEQEFTLVGYVNDEGAILNPPMEVNLLASLIFGRELRGACVIMSGTNPNTQECDGESYDLPSKFYDYLCNDMIKQVEKSLAFSKMLATAVSMARRDKKITKQEFDYISETVEGLKATCSGVANAIDELPEDLKKLLETCMNYMVQTVMDSLGGES